MVYRLVPSYKFRHQSHFGVEDMQKTPFMIGSAVGLVVGVVLSYVLAHYALKADTSSKLNKWFVQLDADGKPTVFKNWQFWVTAVVLCVLCTSIGGGAVHMSA